MRFVDWLVFVALLEGVDREILLLDILAENVAEGLRRDHIESAYAGLKRDINHNVTPDHAPCLLVSTLFGYCIN
jgi:hypothetical protein